MIALCKKCEAQLLAEIAETEGADVSGFYCDHRHTLALTIAQDGEIKYTQISGPVGPGDAAQLMRAFVQELHGPARNAAPDSATEVRH